MKESIIVGIDVSENRSVAVRLSNEDYSNFPTSKAKEFYDICDFYEIQPDNMKSLELLIHLGDIYCFEPTGNYSRYIYDALTEAGKEIRIAPNNVVITWRKNCKWDYSDDEHDAVVLAYFCRQNLDDLGSFNKVRIPELETCYQLLLSKERINDRIRNAVNQGKNLLHHEAPGIRKIDFTGEDRITPMWTWIAGKETSRPGVYINRITTGTYTKTGTFTEELITIASSIDDMQHERARIRQVIKGILNSEKFKNYVKGFNLLQFGIYDQAIILCQIYPFEQFLNPDGGEKRETYKRKKTANGNKKSKRTGLRKFINLCGRGMYKELSGLQQDNFLSKANKISKLTLMQWVKRTIVRENVGQGGKVRKNEIIKMLEERYLTEASPAYARLKGLITTTDEKLAKIDEILDDPKNDKFFKEIILDAIKAKKSPSKTLKGSATENKLKNWLASRSIDKAIKILFKILLLIWKDEEIIPKELFKEEDKRKK